MVLSSTEMCGNRDEVGDLREREMKYISVPSFHSNMLIKENWFTRAELTVGLHLFSTLITHLKRWWQLPGGKLNL